MTDGNRLNYMRVRYYSAEIRRFINQDILLGSIADGQSLNRFAFVTGNPVSFVDPFGLEALIIDNPDAFLAEMLEEFFEPLLELLQQSVEADVENTEIYAGGGAETTKHFLILGTTQGTSIIGSATTGKVCLFGYSCVTVGPGLYNGHAIGFPFGLAFDDIEKSLPGYSLGLSTDYGVGGIAGGAELTCGVDFENGQLTSIGSSGSPVRSGIGLGGWGGIEACHTYVITCFN